MKLSHRISKNLDKFLRQAERKIQTLQGKGFQGGIIKEFDYVIPLLNSLEKRDISVLDIGAHYGEYSLEILVNFPHSKIWAFEPSAESFRVLSENLPRINKFNFALGSRIQHGKLYANESGSTESSLFQRITDKGSGLEKFSHYTSIAINTLDSWNIEKRCFDFAKIDAEGSELDILIGGKETISKIPIIQFEFGGSNIDSRTYFRDLWVFFSELDFKILRMSRSGLKVIEKYRDLDEVFRTTNYLAVSEKIFNDMYS
jgi:FkbM family methyltransferase